MKFFEHFSLREHNTFGIDAGTRYYAEAETRDELVNLITDKSITENGILVLGGGSNLLFTQDFPGLVIKPVFKAIQIIREEEDFVEISVEAGHNWDEFVAFTVKMGYGGLENLSLIPGNCGAAPVQNIGAFGTEVRDHLTELRAIEISTGKERIFTNEDCQFGYRLSIFKTAWKGRAIITHTTYRLTKRNHHYRLDYGNIEKELPNFGAPSPENIRATVISIRNSKLPDPKIIGNAGSFFKNPAVSIIKAEEILVSYPNAPVYPFSETERKLAAGWLIEQAGWKGKSLGNAGVHDKQALVLVNRGGATGKEILNLAEKVQQSVVEKFGLALEMEVNVI